MFSWTFDRCRIWETKSPRRYILSFSTVDVLFNADSLESSSLILILTGFKMVENGQEISSKHKSLPSLQVFRLSIASVKGTTEYTSCAGMRFLYPLFPATFHPDVFSIKVKCRSRNKAEMWTAKVAAPALPVQADSGNGPSIRQSG